MADSVARTYGNALFAFAIEENCTHNLMKEIDTLQAVLNENKDFEKIMMHPEISGLEKLQVIDEVFKEKISDALTGFLRIVVTRGRYKELQGMFAYFMARVMEYRKTGAAQVISAVSLSEVQKQKIEEKLLDSTPYETMEIEFKEDESLIGGLLIRIGDRVVDSTIRSRLDRLTAGLMK